MNEDKLMELLSNMDDDLVEKEVDKLLEEVEIDMDSINKKAHQKLKNNIKKAKHKKRFPFVAVACVCLLCITTVYAKDISEAIKLFFNKTPIYSTMVDGDAYYLEESYKINDDIKIETVILSEGNLKIEIATDLSLSELGEINIIPKNNPNIVYLGMCYWNEENIYHFLFGNKTEKNMNIIPFKDFELIIEGNSYDVSLDKAKSFDENNQIYTCDATANNIKGVNIGAEMIDVNGKLNIRLITAFEDKDLKLRGIGYQIGAKRTCASENTEQGRVGSSSISGGKMIEIFVLDEMNHKYRLDIPKDSKGLPVTIFETMAPKDKKLVLELPEISTIYEKTIDSFSINIPSGGEVDLNKQIDFNFQKGVIKNIKRTSPTSAKLELELNTKGDENISIVSFHMCSPEIKKTSIQFEGDKGIINLEFDENIDKANFEISYPEFVMNGNWVINMNGSK